MASDQRRLGEATVPAIGQGTWNMEADNRAECIRALRRGIDLGLTHLDTAELYGEGEVEELVGQAVKGVRERIFLASKVKPSNASRRGTIEACERSLRRLGTDRLELYLLHWPGPHPLEDTIEAFEQLVRDGKIRAYGVSNFDVDELEQAVRIAGEGRIACNQVLYHLRERHIEAELVPWCVKRRIAVVAYSPFGSWDFPEPTSKGGKVLKELADARGVTPRQIALAFLVRDPHVLAIPKASKVPHVEQNAGALGLTLSKEEVARIDAAFPVVKRGSLPMI